MNLSHYKTDGFDRGKPLYIEILWLLISELVFDTWIPGSSWRCFVLKIFGANLGKQIVLKPKIKIKFPWKLSIGDFSWVGERAWIDNLSDVEIGSNVCISQEVYVCTGNHDWNAQNFDLIIKPVLIKDCAWICAGAKLSPGITIGTGAVLALGSVALHSLEPWRIYSGHPAKIVGSRDIK